MHKYIMTGQTNHYEIIYSALTLLLTFSASAAGSDVTAHVIRNRNANKQSGELGGHDLFRDLVTDNYIFVDKSLLIKDLIESPNKVILVTCPRNWGKTINMDMLKTFFQPEFDQHANRVAKKDAFNYGLFEFGEVNKVKITTFNIARYQNIMGEYLGQTPVVHIIFSSVQGRNFEAVYASFRQALENTFNEHTYMLNILSAKSKSAIVKAQIDSFMKCWHAGKFNAPENEVLACVKFLCELLGEHFKRKPFILVDDYDQPIKSFFTQRKVEVQEVRQTVRFLEKFVNASFSDGHFEKALLTAVMSLEVSKIFSSVPNLKIHNRIRSDFYKHYGLIDAEVTLLFKECGIQGALAERARVEYGGYTIANDIEASLYNMKSINGVLGAKNIDDFWEETPNAVAFSSIFAKMDKVINSLANGTSLKADVGQLFLTVDDYIMLSELNRGVLEGGKTGEGLFLRLIFSEGYLTMDEEHVERRIHGFTYVKAPNWQTATELRWRTFDEDL